MRSCASHINVSMEGLGLASRIRLNLCARGGLASWLHLCARILSRRKECLTSPETHCVDVRKHLFWRLVVLKRGNAPLLRITELGKTSSNKVRRSMCVGLEVKRRIVNRGDEQIVAVDADTAKHLLANLTERGEVS